MKDQVFVIRIHGEECWKAFVNGNIIPADFNSKGAALAAIPVERARLAKKQK